MTVGVDQSLLNQTNTTIKLVQGDTRPSLVVNLTTETINVTTGAAETAPIDVSTATVVMKLRKVNTTTLIDTVTATKLIGVEQQDGSINDDPPYDTPGSGGRVEFFWNENSLSVIGDIEGEIEITFADQTVQTVYNVVKLKVRGQF